MYQRDEIKKIKQNISTAFKELRKDGIYARMNYWDCQSCGWAVIRSDAKKFGYKNLQGFAFYHHQDNESLKKYGELYIAYGAESDNDADAVKVGEQIRNILSKHGLNVIWNGDTNERILVKM